MAQQVHIFKVMDGPHEGQWRGRVSDPDTNELHEAVLAEKFRACKTCGGLEAMRSAALGDADGSDNVQAQRHIASIHRDEAERNAAVHKAWLARKEAERADAELAAAREKVSK